MNRKESEGVKRAHRLFLEDGTLWPDARSVDPLNVNDVAAVFSAYKALCMHAWGANRSVAKIRMLRRAHRDGP